LTPRLLKKRTEKAGLPPGSVVFVGDKKLETTNLNIIDYDETHFLEKEVNTIEECLPFKDLPTVTWFNVEGLLGNLIPGSSMAYNGGLMFLRFYGCGGFNFKYYLYW